MIYPIIRLRLLDLPVFSSTADLSNLICLREKTLNKIAHNPATHYKRFYVSKKSGGVRELHRPSIQLRAIQAWILRYILEKIPISRSATAFIRNKSLLDNVAPHASNRYFCVIDLKDFFPSVAPPRVYTVFRLIGYDERMAFVLTKLTTLNGGLPQGAITSPALANLVCRRLDIRLAALCKKVNLAYTRYADDLTFSGNHPKLLRKNANLIIEIIRSEGFEINKKKLRFLGPRKRTRITGLVKNASIPQFSLGTAKKRQFRSNLYEYLRGNPRSKTLSYDGREKIKGYLSFVKSIDQQAYQTFVQVIRKQDPKNNFLLL